MCGQPLPRPQSNTGSATPTATQANGRATGSLGLRDTPKQMGTLPSLGSRPQSAAPVSTDKKVQFPPIASPPQPSRATAPVTGAPAGPPQGVPVSGVPATGAPANGEKRAQTQPTSAPSSAATPMNPERRPQPPSPVSPVSGLQPSAAGVVERRGPFPRTPLGPQPVPTTTDLSAEKLSTENKMQTPGVPPAPQSATPERRAQNQPSYSQSSESRPLTADAFDRPASAQKPAAPESRRQTQSLDASAFDRPATSDKGAVSERGTQPVSSTPRPAATAIPPAKRAQASAQ